MTNALEKARARWSGRTAVVTGGAGGLGAGFVETLVGIGADVVFCDVHAAASRGGLGRGVVADVRDDHAMAEFARNVFDSTGGVALLVNNAGVESVGLPWEQTPEEWRRVIDVNLTGVYNCVRAFVPLMIDAGADATVFNIASVGALTTSGRNAAYQVSKHGVLALSEALADGLSSVGSSIQVSVALPGPVHTRIYEDAAAAGDTIEHLGGLRSLLEGQGMAPDAAAADMLEQVARGEFAVSSHPDWVRRLAEQRSATLSRLVET